MTFDPRVLESITSYRRKRNREQAILVAPFVLAVLLGALLLVFTLIARQWIAEVFNTSGAGDTSWTTQATLFVKILTAPLLVVLVAGFGYHLYASVRYARARFGYFINQQACEYGPTALDKFTEALQGAAIGAGVEAPALCVLDDPGANAVAFEDEYGGRGVGVTAGLLEADISVGEANGIMAHELSHLVIGENVRAPDFSDVEFQPSLLLLAFGTLATVSVIASPPPSFLYVVAEVACVAAVVVFLMIRYRSESFIVKLLNLAYQHDDLLADSLAIKVTGDPAALQSAIRKVDAVARGSGRVPGGTVLAKYLFVTPPTSPGDYFRYATEVAGEMLGGRKQPRTWMLFSGPTNRATRKVLELESRMTTERLINLDLIEQGRWRALEDWEQD
jgi:Zn-dependent protease with chaperone function